MTDTFDRVALLRPFGSQFMSKCDEIDQGLVEGDRGAIHVRDRVKELRRLACSDEVRAADQGGELGNDLAFIEAQAIRIARLVDQLNDTYVDALARAVGLT